MKQSTEAVWERAMKIHEVMLRAMAKRITWWQAAEIIGISCRQMRRWAGRGAGARPGGLGTRRPGRRPGKGGRGARRRRGSGGPPRRDIAIYRTRRLAR